MSESLTLEVLEKRRKSCAIIVMYNKIPDLSTVLKALSNEELDSLFISDNSNKKDMIEGIENQIPLDLLSRVRIIRNGSNLGISKALNAAFHLGLEGGFYYFFLLDDDAKISYSLFSISRYYYEKLERAGENVGVVCPVVSNDFEELNKRLRHFPEISPIELFINSGALIASSCLKVMGGYEESFFLEYADSGFSSRLPKYGFKIYRINTVLVAQEFGKNVDSNGFSAKLYNRVWPIYSLIKIKFGTTNDLQRIGSYYTPEREKIINQGAKTLINKRKSSTNYVRQSKVKYIITYFVASVKMIVRETFLYFIFKDERYLRSIVL